MGDRFTTDPRLRAVPWRDLLPLSPAEMAWELTLSLPWLVGSLVCYHTGWTPAGAVCSFFFFLTGLRQSHGAQHYSLGIPRVAQDLVLMALSPLMLASMHAVQVSHLHHHRHCLGDGDAEGSVARLPWWRALLLGPVFVVRLHARAWQLASRAKCRWIAIEIAALALMIAAALATPGMSALRWHVAAMLAGEWFIGFFAVWIVHHGCDHDDLLARTQRGRWINWLSYGMFYHFEHHLFPSVPTCRLKRLADRLDDAAPEIDWKQVVSRRTMPIVAVGNPTRSRKRDTRESALSGR